MPNSGHIRPHNDWRGWPDSQLCVHDYFTAPALNPVGASLIGS